MTAITTRTTPSRLSTRPAARQRSPRFVLLAAGVIGLLLTLGTLAYALIAYSNTYSIFQITVNVSAAKVNASEAALTHAAAMNNAAALLIATATDDPKHWSSIDTLRTEFTLLREQLAIIRGSISTAEEEEIYRNIDYFVFDAYSIHIGNLLTAERNGDRETAIQQYIIADNYLQNQLSRYLLQLEQRNFNEMVNSKNRFVQNISGSAIGVGVFGGVVAIFLTIISFWMRRKLKRVLTPGLDLAMLLGWLLVFTLVFNLQDMARLLNTMVDNTYLSITASARILAVFNQAHSSQSSAIIDPDNKTIWIAQFDRNKAILEDRVCGGSGCTNTSFLIAPTRDQIAAAVIGNANSGNGGRRTITLETGLKPLVASVNYSGEALAIEDARIAFLDYLKVNAAIRERLQRGDVEDATFLVTGENAGYSGEAFNRFVKKIQDVRQINQQFFESDWRTVQDVLNRGQLLYILIGYGAIFILIILGVYHRFREL
jgi:hypothetical protein